MKKQSILMFILLTVFTSGLQTVSAQITITIPKIPKIKREKTEKTAPTQTQNKTDEFDMQKFEAFASYWRSHLECYLACYAKKHNLDLEKVGGKGFEDPFYTVYEQMEERLTREQKDMAKIEVELKEKFRSRPNNGLPYDKNPAIWEEIATNRTEYLQCALNARKANVVKSNLWLQRHLEEIAERQKEVESFTPERDWFTDKFTYDHVLNAVSPRAREKWLKGSNAMDFKQYVDPPLDVLAVVVAKKLPLYQPNTKSYPIRNPLEEKLMKAALKNIASLKIHKIGLKQATWLIDKDNIGIPTARYKHGMLWVRDSADDHPYCHFYYVNIIQDYAGGGTYAASYAKFVGSELAGCPASQ